MISYIVIVILIILSALFSGSEIAYSSSSEIKLRKRLDSNKSLSNRLAYDIYNDFSNGLITILIGNNLVNIGSSSLATVIAISLMGDKGAASATAIMSVLIIIFGEITPKIIATKSPESFARLVSIPLKGLMVITRPFVYVVNAALKAVSKLWVNSVSKDEVTEDDLETIIDTVEEEGVIDEDTADLLQNALDFDDVQAYEIITHRLDVDGLDVEDTKEKNIEKILNTEFSRLPVYKASLDETLGYIVVDECIKALIKDELDLKKLLKEAVFVHKTMLLDDVLNIMRKNNAHMVFVSDEYGGTMGIVTMEDVLEQIVGEIWDEKDEVEEDIEEVRKDTYEVQGETRIEDFFDEIEFIDEEFESDNATIGGWAIEMLNEYPDVGDSFDYKNLHFTITEMEDKRVKELRVKVNEIEDDE